MDKIRVSLFMKKLIQHGTNSKTLAKIHYEEATESSMLGL